MSANVETMMYVGEKPWHGLGTKLDKPATSAEAIKAAGLDWEVKKVPVFAMDLHSHPKQIPNKFAVRRQDNGVALSVTGKFYNPLQNKDAFKFFDAVVGEKAAMYHTAGALGNGERVWLLAKLPNDVVVKGKDVVEKFLLLMNSHDGTSTVIVKMTPIRVVCQNTLTEALGDGEDMAKLRHTRWLANRVQDVKEQLGLVNKWYQEFGVKANQLASVKCDDDAFMKYITRLGIVTPNEDGDMGPKTQAMLEDILTRFADGEGEKDKEIRGTWWGAYNAVTSFVNHSEQFGKSKKLNDRARSLLYGAGSFLQRDAWKLALAESK